MTGGLTNTRLYPPGSFFARLPTAIGMPISWQGSRIRILQAGSTRNGWGVTDLPLLGLCEKRFPGNQVALRIKALGFPVDPLHLESIPLVANPNASHIQHGLGSFQRPVHTGPLHAVFDQVPAGALDDTAGDRVTRA